MNVRVPSLTPAQAQELLYISECYANEQGYPLNLTVGATYADLPAEHLDNLAWAIGAQYEIARDNGQRGKVNALASIRRKVAALGGTDSGAGRSWA